MHTRRPLLLALVFMTGCSDCSDVRDPIADVECFATFEPCGPGNTQVSACAPSARCFPVERCGEQILCALGEQDMGATPDMDAPDLPEPLDMTPCAERPECAPGEQELARCPAGASCAAPCPEAAECSRRSACGESVVCADLCDDPLPQCEPGLVLHDYALPYPEGTVRSFCGGVSAVCGRAFGCCRFNFGDACDPTIEPQCRVGEREVETCMGSPYPCEERTTCSGGTISCEELQRDCDVPPTCPTAPPTTQVETCAPGQVCFPVTQCAQTILCQPTDGCTPPVCPPNAQQVMACAPDDASCIELNACRQTIACDFPDGCAPQLAEGLGSCGQLHGVRWNGITCEAVSGCACVGSGCAALYATIPECEADRTRCASTL